MVHRDLEATESRPGCHQEAFRLVDDILEASSAASVSSDKQRIDAMFDETRSSISRTPPAKGKGKGMRRAAGRKASSASASSVAESAAESVRSSTKGNVNANATANASASASVSVSANANAVQDRIEKMFAEMSAAGGSTQSGVYGVYGVTPGNRFTVDYLGSVPIADKVTTLQGLQEPLRQLYVGYRRIVAGGGGGGGVGGGGSGLWEPGFVDISKDGLKVQHGRLDQLNPFPTIAVWAAVKFVCRVRANTSSYEYAFLPLIADPDGVDRDALFQVMSSDDQRDLCPDVGAPMFAVVMRKVGVSRQLQCHAFVCSSSEDAVVMAANLYQALMTSMRAAAANATTASRMHHENGFGRISIAGSVCGDEPVPPAVPKRPPRKKKINPAPSDPPPPAPPPVATVASLRGNFPSSHRRASLTKTFSNSASDPPTGDILTKVAIPRSRSFLHANGPLMRYGRRGDAALPAPPTASASPLGFHELFAEFRQQEGLESLDDILGAIIDAEGMSYNDLKPIYKEFLLKLALTLTKDELYQRSKQIMHKQKKKQHEGRRRRGFGVAVAAAHIKRTLRRSLGRLRKRVRRKPNKTSHKTPSTAYVRNKAHKPAANAPSRSVRVSQTVENACNVNVNVSISNARGNKSSRRRSVETSRCRSTTSDDSDFFTTIRCDTGLGPKGPARPAKPVGPKGLKGPKGPKGPKGRKHNKAPSGYISYSDCGYDSESCTCASAERCYCSHRGCSCDTDSCVGSDKCYCTRPRNKYDATPGHPRPGPRPSPRPGSVSGSGYPGGVLEQLKRQGFVASESSLSRAASPSTAWRRNEKRMAAAAACAAASAGSVRSTKSLEFVHMWPRPIPLPRGSGANRMDMYRTEERKPLLDTDYQSRRSRQHKKMLVVSARDPKGRVIYMGASCRNELQESMAAAKASASVAKPSKQAMSQFLPRATLTTDRKRRTSAASTTSDVFSVKKSAEIAALFANVKMSQTTDIIARSTDATATDTSTSTTTTTYSYSSLDCPAAMFPPATARRSSNNAHAHARGGLEGSLGYLP